MMANSLLFFCLFLAAAVFETSWQQPNGCANPPPWNGGSNTFGASSFGDFTQTQFMQPVPTWSYIYECQNTTLFLGVFNMSLKAYDNMVQPQNIYVNTVTCATTVPAGPAAGIFDVTTYNSCDNAGACGSCGGCNCTCRVTDPWWWNCCNDPCFGCAECCTCQTVNVWNWANLGPTIGSCLQCGSDGWYQYNGQLLTPTVCQFALAAVNPSNNLDYESLASSNFSYQVRILQRTIGCQACNAQDLANMTIYVKDCNEWPVFDTHIKGVPIYQYEGLTGQFSAPTLNVIVRDPDIYTLPFNTVDLNVVKVVLTNVGAVNPIPFYITNPHFVGHNGNGSVLSIDASRCGAGIQSCLDMFRYSYSGAATPIFTVYVTATDGGGLVTSYSYSITILNTPLAPSWVNLPATISVVEGTTGPLQIYPMEAIVPGYSTPENTVNFLIINVQPAVSLTGGPYMSAVQPCSPAAASAVQCGGLSLTPAVIGTTLSYTANNQYNVTVWMTNQVAGSGTVFTISSSVIINILQKVYQPTLNPASDTAYLKENVTGRACFYTITGISSLNGHTNFLFSFVTPPAHNAFFLNGSNICYDSSYQTSGPAAAPSWTFDAAITPAYTLQVSVNDYLSAMPPPVFTLTVNIVNVEDPPVLTYPLYQIVPESATAWSVTVSATKEANMPALTFSLIGQNSSNHNTMWYIASQTSTVLSTAALANIQTIPSFAPPIFNFSVAPVIYQDFIVYTPSYTVTGRITFLIQRTNHPPQFVNLPNYTSIAEAIHGYVPFYTVTTTDPENDPRQVYFRDPLTGLLSSYDTTGLFHIDPAMNIIQTNISPLSPIGFSYFATPVYTLTVCCVDSPAFPNSPTTATSSIIVYIVLNQTAPTFTTPVSGSGATITPNILENVSGQKYLYTLQSTDREGDTVYYNITDVRPTWNTAFRIPWRSNLVEYNSNYATSTPMFDYSKRPVYYIVVEVSDQKTTPTSTVTLTVSIDRVDKPAVWTSLPAYVSVREDVYWGPTDLVQVQAIDPNGLYPVTISYIGVSPPSGSTKLYYNTATKNVGYNLDPQFAYGVVNSYIMTFTAFNTIQPTITGSVVVQILKVPTGPNVNITNAIVYLHENVTVGQTLWDMRARSNSSLTLQYAVMDINPAGFDKFYITNQGVIRSVNRPNFNYQSAPVYVIRTTATDALGMAVTFTLTVSIINDPEPPVITSLPSFAAVKEGAVGVVFGGLHNTKCVDQDSRPLTWNYNVLPNTGFSDFNITSTGVITTTSQAAFSYADQAYYYVVAFCSNGYYTATGTLTVAVIWSTSTTSTTQAPRTTIPDYILYPEQSQSGDLLTPNEIGAIVGSLLGALAIALGAWGIARWLQRKSRKDGTVDKMKSPASTLRNTTV